MAESWLRKGAIQILQSAAPFATGGPAVSAPLRSGVVKQKQRKKYHEQSFDELVGYRGDLLE
jgi:hypothetical protein